MINEDDGSFDYSNMGRRPELTVEACALRVMAAAGVDIQKLREKLLGMPASGFTTEITTTAHTATHRQIRRDRMPVMRGRRHMRMGSDEIVFEMIDMGHGLRYVASGSHDAGSTVHLEVETQRLPETIMLGMTGLPVASLISHEWLTDQGVTVIEARNQNNILLMRVEPTWVTL